MNRLIKTTVNSVGAAACAARIASGDVDKSSQFDFSAADAQKLDDRAKWFLGVDASGAQQYPFGKNGKVYRSALVAIRSSAARTGDDGIFAAAGVALDLLDGKPASVKAPRMIQRAWAGLEVKAVDDYLRVLEGVATTPTPDRMDDIVEPDGAEFNLPLPFLWQHDSEQPVGAVTTAKVTPEGIPVRIEMAKLDEPGTLKDRLDEAWQSIKIKLVRGLSIGFAPIEYSYMEDTGGYRFIRWAWLELSAVTIPANADATIVTIKSYGSKNFRRRAHPRVNLSLPAAPDVNILVPPANRSAEQQFLDSLKKSVNKRVMIGQDE